MNVPNLFLVGAPKAGTTSVAELLASHPDVFLGYPKEPCYLSSDLDSRATSVRLDSESDYLAIYEPGSDLRYRLDASTTYLRSTVAVSAALNLDPDAKFIVCLRNPVDLLVAYHGEMLFNLNEDVEDVSTAVALWPSRQAGQQIPERCVEPAHLDYLRVASLGSQLRQLRALVPPAQILTLRFEWIKNDPARVNQELMDFLDLSVGLDGVVGHRKSKRKHRFGVLANFYQDPPRFLVGPLRVAKRIVRSQDRLRSLVTGLLTEKDERKTLPAAVRERLKEQLQSEVDIVEQETGWSVDDWRN